MHKKTVSFETTQSAKNSSLINGARTATQFSIPSIDVDTGPAFSKVYSLARDLSSVFFSEFRTFIDFSVCRLVFQRRFLFARLKFITGTLNTWGLDRDSAEILQ
jgi:hypothetical protein